MNIIDKLCLKFYGWATSGLVVSIENPKDQEDTVVSPRERPQSLGIKVTNRPESLGIYLENRPGGRRKKK